jgi:DNA-binding NarL/FixJ family response regulator
MSRSTDVSQGLADPLPGCRASRTGPGDRANVGPGWRIPAPRAAGSAEAKGTPFPGPTDRREVLLSERDQELVRHLSHGRSTAQIAAAMSVSSNTARTRIRRIAVKLAVTDRSDVVRAARMHGLV